MAILQTRVGLPSLRVSSLKPVRLARIRQPRALYTLSLKNAFHHRACKLPQSPLTTKKLRLQVLSHRYPSTSLPYSTSANPNADQLIEELQDLYEAAKDEFEIAIDSTDGSTIYAASDRESARDALNQLCAVYHLYTARPGEDADTGSHAGASTGKVSGESAIVETNYNPADIASEVRDQVRKRIGQRIREIKNAVEVLEERAKAD
ncbi:hypothetical protein N7462_000500 [Penicillium macrosclerotiorum]|uniref:uncharacterized protein n=1 Tax=Penicillium macrosclerotiorum TaxID=303699 RepID=UPI0025473889|nr:uncharacterized protein N7462_000500 [Penicillium macrosclerotiorum]KAJ5698495.1 hypothetical protein N7462_000500 [Penicillium macrosclerotiorum]